MKKITFFIFFLLGTLELMAQQSDFAISLIEDENQQKSFNFQVEKIIDARKDKAKIGTIYRILKNHDENIVFYKSLENEILSILPKPNTTTQLKKLILRINEISINEIEEHLLASSSVSITFIEQNGKELMELFTATETITKKTQKINKKIFYGDLVAQNVQNAITSFKKRYYSNKLKQQTIDSIQLYEAKGAYSLPKLSDLKIGEYPTFYDFRDNTPDSIQGQITYKKSSTQNRIEGILPMIYNQWGFFDGKQLFVKSKGKAYLPIFDDQNRFIYYQKLSEFSYKSHVNENELISSMTIGAGGLAGGVLALIMKNTKTDSPEEILFSLNINKGIFDVAENLPDTRTRVYIVNSTYSYLPSIEVELNDNQKCSILAAEFLKYSPKNQEGSLKVCLNFEHQDKICETTTISAQEKIFLILSTKDGKKINLTWKKEDIFDADIVLDDFKKQGFLFACSLY